MDFCVMRLHFLFWNELCNKLIFENELLMKSYKPPKFHEEKEIIQMTRREGDNSDDVDAVFNDSEVRSRYLFSLLQDHLVTEKKETEPVLINTFELISMSQGVNLNILFQKLLYVI